MASPGVDVSDTAADFVADGIITISGERKLEREDKGENAIRIESVYGAFARSFVAVCLAVLHLLGDGAIALRPVGRKT